MQYTTNYNLKKPESNDTANINDLNENMDIIDQKLKEASQNEQLQGDVTEIKGTTEEIKTSVGSSGDLSSSPTLFGRLAEIKETLTSKFSEVVSKITGVDGKIGTSGDSRTDTVFGKLNNIFDIQKYYAVAGDTYKIDIFKNENITMSLTSNSSTQYRSIFTGMIQPILYNGEYKITLGYTIQFIESSTNNKYYFSTKIKKYEGNPFFAFEDKIKGTVIEDDIAGEYIRFGDIGYTTINNTELNKKNSVYKIKILKDTLLDLFISFVLLENAKGCTVTVTDLSISYDLEEY